MQPCKLNLTALVQAVLDLPGVMGEGSCDACGVAVSVTAQLTLFVRDIPWLLSWSYGPCPALAVPSEGGGGEKAEARYWRDSGT